MDAEWRSSGQRCRRVQGKAAPRVLEAWQRFPGSCAGGCSRTFFPFWFESAHLPLCRPSLRSSRAFLPTHWLLLCRHVYFQLSSRPRVARTCRLFSTIIMYLTIPLRNSFVLRSTFRTAACLYYSELLVPQSAAEEFSSSPVETSQHSTPYFENPWGMLLESLNI